MEKYKITEVKEHYEAYDKDGNFIVSGDTWNECYNDLMEILVTEAKMENIREKVIA